MIKLIKLNSDNFENAILTPDAYHYIRVQMSSGDFGSHSAEVFYVKELDKFWTDAQVITLEDLKEEETEIEASRCPHCGKL